MGLSEWGIWVEIGELEKEAEKAVLTHKSLMLPGEAAYHLRLFKSESH